MSDADFEEVGRRLAAAEGYYEAAISMTNAIPEWSGGGERGGSEVRRRVEREERTLDHLVGVEMHYGEPTEIIPSVAARREAARLAA